MGPTLHFYSQICLVLNCEILFTDHVSDYLKIEEKQPPSLSIESFKEFSTGHLVQYDDIVSERNLQEPVQSDLHRHSPSWRDHRCSKQVPHRA